MVTHLVQAIQDAVWVSEDVVQDDLPEYASYDMIYNITCDTTSSTTSHVIRHDLQHHASYDMIYNMTCESRHNHPPSVTLRTLTPSMCRVYIYIARLVVTG